MGGNALKNVKIVRISLLKLNDLKVKIREKIGDELDIDFMIENPEKRDFGDLDVIYKLNPDSKVIVKDLIKELFSPVEIIVNGDIISFAYPSDVEGEFFQIDFIKCKNLNMSKFYFSFDFGNIFGYITNSYNIKLGHFGLFVNITRGMFEGKFGISDSNCYNFNEKIYLTEEPSEICDFFKLDYSKWVGLDSEHKIFNWLCSSPYFSKSIYDEVSNKRSRNINSRPMYIRFIEWMGNLEESNNFKKYDRRMEAIKYFNLEVKLGDILRLNKIKQERRDKFNGNKIMEKGYVDSNKELGDFIKKFKEYIIGENCDFDKWLDDNSLDIIDEKIKMFVLLNKKLI